MKRFIISSLVTASALCAQSASVTTSTDLSGNVFTSGAGVIQTKTPTGTETTYTTRSINGRTVPVEKVSVNVLRDDASGKVVERIVQQYDQQGNPTTPTKETIEEVKRPDGSSSIATTTYRGDINGNLQVAEKSITEVRKSGSQETADTVIQKPTINGSLDTVEKQSQVTVKEASGAYRQDATTFRRDGSGSFYEAVRTSTQHVQNGAEASDNTAEYEADSNGQLQLHSQTVSKTITSPDGSKEVVTDIFGQNIAGLINSNPGTLKLQERQVIEEKTGANGVTQTVSIRRPSISDASTLGPPQQLSQTVCQGACKP